MKNLLKITLLFLAASIMFVSCKTMSVTKRHYNKGYYVSHSAKKNKLESNNAAKEAVVKNVEQLALKAIDGIKDQPSNPELLASNVTNKKESTTEAQTRKTIENKIKYAGKSNIKFKDVYKNPFKITKMVAAKDSNKDGLSLIWILIVVILIIYLLGFLFDGFGLGNLIHILAIIALVLLILWLLKVI